MYEIWTDQYRSETDKICDNDRKNRNSDSEMITRNDQSLPITLSVTHSLKHAEDPVFAGAAWRMEPSPTAY